MTLGFRSRMCFQLLKGSGSSKAVIRRGEFGSLGPDGNCWPQMACTVPSFDNKFNWEGDLPPKYPQKDLIMYEMHVRGYTRQPGTYLGLVEKLDHLKGFDSVISCESVF